MAVNCAAIPPSIAERLLFGARRGAYSGADADAPGYLQKGAERLEACHLSPSAGTAFGAATARALGMHRTQLRRLLERHALAPPAADERHPSEEP